MNWEDKWQVEVGGSIYEAEFAELENWIDEGSLLRKDLVRRGSLRWIEAEKVPALVGFFKRKENETAPHSVIAANTAFPPLELPDEQIHVTSEALNIHTKNRAKQTNYQEFGKFAHSLKNFEINNQALNETAVKDEQATAEFCCLHPEIESFYYCETCVNGFCKSCPKSYGGTVKICPCCGAMCRAVTELRQSSPINQRQRDAQNENFGFADFGRALFYPFRFKASLIFGAIFYAFFAFGQIASAFGGVLAFAALVCYLGTNMLSFGILANVVENFSQGKIDADFMPRFDDFSIWEDVVHPFLLLVGVYLISFGVFAVILIGGIWYSSGSGDSSENQELMQTAAKLNVVKRQTQNPDEPLTAESVEKSHNDENAKIQTLMREMENKDSETQNTSGAPPNFSPLAVFSSFPPPFFWCLVISLIWGMFYFPAACAVAGYTRSFAAVINLSIGFDTIKRFGADYLKILTMFVLLLIFAGLFSALAQTLLKPLDVPLMGNIPVKIISGILTFYLSIVFACILGFALFKNGEKLELIKR